MYELKEGESLEDFEACECGGKLKSVKDINKKSSAINQNYEDVLIKHLVELKENINLKAILLGTIVILILSIIIAILIRDSNNILILNTPQESLYIPFAFIAALVTGYIVGKDPKFGILNGIISSIIATLISLFIIIFAINTPNITYPNDLLNSLFLIEGLINSKDQYFQLIFSINTLIITLFMGALAGFLGVYLKIRDPSKKGVKLKWKPTIIGILISIILGYIFSPYTEWGFFISIFIATIFIGYIVRKNYENGIIHGILIGVVSILIFGIISIILGGTLFGVGTAAVLILLTVSEVIISGTIGAIGGTIGVLIKER